jgi:hypothetical protein
VYVAESGERERLEQLAADASRPDHQHLRCLHARAPRRTRTHQGKTLTNHPCAQAQPKSDSARRGPSLTLTASSEDAAADIGGGGGGGPAGARPGCLGGGGGGAPGRRRGTARVLSEVGFGGADGKLGREGERFGQFRARETRRERRAAKGMLSGWLLRTAVLPAWGGGAWAAQPARCPLVSRRARLDAAFKARLVPPRFLRIYLLKDFLLTIVVGTMDFILFYCIALDNLTTSNICHYQE